MTKPPSWTQRSASSDCERARWSQLKRSFALPAPLARARQERIRLLAEAIHEARAETGERDATAADVALAVMAIAT